MGRRPKNTEQIALDELIAVDNKFEDSTSSLIKVEQTAKETGYSQPYKKLVGDEIYPNNKPVNPVKFNSEGLRFGVKYEFDEIGFIDWSKMIDSKYIVANRYNFEKRKEAIPTDISLLDEKDKLILLWGFKKVALLRGYNSIKFTPIVATENLISLECQICWRGNVETDFRDVCFSGCGDAHEGNTFNFAKKYLTAIAENRAFVRAVRNSLNIPILGQDEIGPDQDFSQKTNDSPQKTHPTDLLEARLKERGKSFESFKAKVQADGICDTSSWQTVKDVPVGKILEILGKYFKKE